MEMLQKTDGELFGLGISISLCLISRVNCFTFCTYKSSQRGNRLNICQLQHLLAGGEFISHDATCVYLQTATDF